MKAGDWANTTFAQDSTCAATGLSCADYVKYHPEAFESAYWTVNVLKVYFDDGFGPVVLPSIDTTPASTSIVSIVSPMMTVFNPSLPTPFSGNSFLDSISSLPTSLPKNDTVVAGVEQQVGTEQYPPLVSGPPSPTTLYVTTVTSVRVVHYTPPPSNEYGDDSPVGSYYHVRKMRRAHRAARHL